jgi:pimeloyl-ACP methyl ester carboxylesterase
MSSLKTIKTKVLEIAFLDEGAAAGWPVILAHGFPYDVHAYDEVVLRLKRAGARVIVPYLRGFGPTRFLSAGAMRSGQLAALGHDLIDLLDGLGIPNAILAGYDWGGLASCVASALWPERVTGLVSYAGYDVIDVERLRHAYAPALEQMFWYQHLFQLERGRECLTQHRRDLCRILWEQVFQHFSYDWDTWLDKERPAYDASQAIQLAKQLGQPAGSTLCFGVDGADENFIEHGDPSGGMSHIKNYFGVVTDLVTRAGYVVGVYGSGFSCDELVVQSEKSPRFCWLSMSTGHPHSQAREASGKWTIKQCAERQNFLGTSTDVDPDVVNISIGNLGQW